MMQNLVRRTTDGLMGFGRDADGPKDDDAMASASCGAFG